MTAAIRPERRLWGPPVRIDDVDVAADVFRGLQDVVAGVSVAITQTGCEAEVCSIGISILGWRALSAWLANSGSNLESVLTNLEREGWISDAAERRAAKNLLEGLRSNHVAWADFADPHEPDLLELVADW